MVRYYYFFKHCNNCQCGDWDYINFKNLPDAIKLMEIDQSCGYDCKTSFIQIGIGE